jgi:hypothetical protein
MEIFQPKYSRTSHEMNMKAHMENHHTFTLFNACFSEERSDVLISSHTYGTVEMLLTEFWVFITTDFKEHPSTK